MNIALLSKLAWLIVENPHSLLTKIFKAKYERFQGWWSCKKSAIDSSIWKGVMVGMKHLQNKICSSVGSEKCILIGFDPWVPGVLDMILRINPWYQSPLWVSEMIGGILNLSTVCFTVMMQNAYWLFLLLKVIKLISFYIMSSNGQVSVNKAYSVITEEHMHGASLAIKWHKWWKIKIAPRLLLLGWKIARNILPTKDSLVQRCYIC